MALLSSASSLVEVGIGINLAYTWIKGVQNTIDDSFSIFVTKVTVSVKTRAKGSVSEEDADGFCETFDTKIRAIKRDMKAALDVTTNHSSAFTILSAILLSTILVYSTFKPDIISPLWFLVYLTYLAFGPIISTVFVQAFYYGRATYQIMGLNKKFGAFLQYSDDFNADISHKLDK